LEVVKARARMSFAIIVAAGHPCFNIMLANLS
jgi:hypothetical protein